MTAKIDEIFVLWGTVFAIVDIETDRTLEVWDRIEIVQNELSLSASREAWRLVDRREAQPSGPEAPRRAGTPAAASRSGTRQYLAACTTSDATKRFNPAWPCQASVWDRYGNSVRQDLYATPVSPQWLAETALKGAIHDAFEEAGQSDLVGFLRSPIAVLDAEAFRPFHIDRAVAGASGLVLEGWIPQVGDRQVAVVSGDFSILVTKPALATRLRPDVHEYLSSNGLVKGGSNIHSFAAVLPAEGNESEREFYFLERGPFEDEVKIFGPVRAPVRRNEREALDIVRQFFGDIQSLPASFVDPIYRPFLSLPKTEALAKRFHFGPPVQTGGGLSSIIIPFYGDAFFLNCVYHLQRVLGPGFELILVVDDPRIWPEIYGRLASRSKSITIPTVLLQNADNYGFGRTNNLGFMAASGDVVFLMNSDIMVLDPAPLHEAASAIRARREAGEPELVVGFSLLYEDNTIQHIGMEFTQSSLVGGMHLADHPMKGLPFGLYRGETIRSAPAVTAALMGLSSDLYGRLGGFDTVYERGDFEDADLCLRAEQLGAEMQVFVRPGLYHLERQSIPSMGDGDLRQMVTYMNCVAFNQRWQTRLAPPEPEAKPVRRIQVIKRTAVGA
ncbi:glycosyltransferase [Microvirga sp. VF16]|uniref:glycosyltransferase n=1 Tax=Microvirga sp. VF16 TaxID=2807101 RepID=UPI00193C9124|nr:hypothetical protein [Microvirga sp. VF16]QRM35598.1 hypothetical protein JO965_42995 [Microvirga sp. VF16]